MVKTEEIEGAEDTRISPNGKDSGSSVGDSDDSAKEEGSTVMIDEAHNLLSHKWESIHGARGLELLQNETKIQDLLPFLKPILIQSSEAQRNYSRIKSLSERENLQVKSQLHSLKKEAVKITESTVCPICTKNIGTSEFAVYPDARTIVHLACLGDSQGVRK